MTSSEAETDFKPIIILWFRSNKFKKKKKKVTVFHAVCKLAPCGRAVNLVRGHGFHSLCAALYLKVGARRRAVVRPEPAEYPHRLLIGLTQSANKGSQIDKKFLMRRMSCSLINSSLISSLFRVESLVQGITVP